MLQSLRQNLILVLLGLLPFHAFLVTVGTKLLVGPGHAPLVYLALWKEAVLGVILVIAVIEIIRKRSLVIGHWSLDMVDMLIIGLVTLGIVVTHFQSSIFNLQFIYGVKYDFIPLIAFLIVRRVEWSDLFMNRLLKVLLAVAGVIAVYGILGMYMHQQFFVWLGYSDLHSLYQPDAPLAAFQHIGGSAIRRIQSTMSGPNQLGLWLLIPLSILLTRKNVVGCRLSVVGGFILFAMLLTLSRSALLAAAVLVGVMLWRQLPRKRFIIFAAVIFGLSLVFLLAVQSIAPSIVSRAASTREHINRPLQALQIMIENPLGLGLGTAGPASNRVSNTCVFLQDGSDASWAQVHENLCVFVGDEQVQPLDIECACPFLPENWYLQIGVELGVIGFLLYISLIFIVLKKLSGLKIENGKLKMESSIFNLQSSIYLMFIGISIAALFLHAWEDAAIAYTVWILVSIALQRTRLR